MSSLDFILYHTIGLSFESYLTASDLYVMQQVCTSAHDGYWAIKFRKALSKLKAMDDTLLQEIPLRVIAKSFKLSIPFLYSMIEFLYYKKKIQLYTLILAQAELKTYDLQVLNFIQDYYDISSWSFHTLSFHSLTKLINPFAFTPRPIDLMITDISKRSNPKLVQTLLTHYDKQLTCPYVYALDPAMRNVYTKHYMVDETYGLNIKADFLVLTIKEAIACKDTYPLIAYVKVKYNLSWLDLYLETLIDSYPEFCIIDMTAAKELALKLLQDLEDPDFLTYHRMCYGKTDMLKGRRYLWSPFH